MFDESNASPMWKATTVELFLVKKYLAPFCTYQFELSWSYLKPLLVRSWRHQSTTWKADGEALTNSRNLSAKSLLLFKSYPYISLNIIWISNWKKWICYWIICSSIVYKVMKQIVQKEEVSLNQSSIQSPKGIVK